MPRVSVVPIPSVAGMEKTASKAKEHVSTDHVQAPKTGVGATGAPVMVAVPVFNQTIGMHQSNQQGQHSPTIGQRTGQHPTYNLPLTKNGQQSTARAPKTRQRSISENAKSSSEEERLEEAIDSLLAVLKHDSDTNNSSDLEERYDPLERFQLFEETLKRLEREDMPSSEKKRIRERLQHMSGDLYRRHRRELEGARPAMDKLQDIAEQMGIAGLSGDALRSRLGAPGKPLEAMDLATKLFDKVGDDGFMKAMSAVSKGMLGDLRTRMDGLKLLMSLKDAEAISIIRSSFKAAGDLRTQLGPLNVRTRMSPAAMAIQLMSIAQSGKIKAGSLISEMLDLDNVRPHTLARAFIVTRETLDTLPLSMWPADKSAKQEILAELHAQIVGAFANLPAKPTREQRLEQFLRGRLRSIRGS